MVSDINIEKNTGIKQLQKKVSEVESEVTLYETMYEALTSKQSSCVDALNNAESKQQSILSDLKQINSVVSSFKDIEQSSKVLNKQSEVAYEAACKTPEKLEETVNSLIEAIDQITELQNFVDQQLTPNEHSDISDYLHQATSDANVAVTATLTAMVSSYKGMVTNGNVSNMSSLEYKQVKKINHLLIGDLSITPDEQKLEEAINSLEKSREALLNAHENYIEIVNVYVDNKTSEVRYQSSHDDIEKLIKQVFKDYETVKKLSEKRTEKSMLNQLNAMYEKSLKNYQMHFQDHNIVNKQLQEVSIKLANAKNKRKSLNAGLEAAKLASGLS